MGQIQIRAKQIFLALGLFFSFSNLNAMCPQTVGAINPGEGIWRVTSRIGEASNVIQSQLCTLSGGGAASCTFTFGQADIGGGNIYTISTPGTYCMSENVTFSFGPAITVNSGDVTIDLGGHTIDGAHTTGLLAGSAIILENFINNVTIQNGTIENITDVSSHAIRDSFSSNPNPTNATLTNIVIKNINFNNNFNPIGIDTALISGNYVDGLLVEDCNSFGTISSELLVSSISTVVRGCLFQSSINIRQFVITGPSTKYAAVEDCVISNTGSRVGFIFVVTDNAVVRNCVLQGPFNQGIQMNARNVVVSDCILEGGSSAVANYGISLDRYDTALIERCFVAGNATGFYLAPTTFNFYSLQVIDCVAERNQFNGFYVEAVANSAPVSNIVFRGCSAQSNGLNGFLLDIGSFGSLKSISDITFENCFAQHNSGDGFALLNRNAINSLISNVAFIDCVSQHNLGGTDGVTTWLGEGFGVGSGSTNVGPIYAVICQNCLAQNNAHDGFNFASTATGGKILDCCAMNNTGTGINSALGDTNAILGNSAFNNGTDVAGVTDLTLLVSRSFPGALAGSSRWVNAIS